MGKLGTILWKQLYSRISMDSVTHNSQDDHLANKAFEYRSYINNLVIIQENH